MPIQTVPFRLRTLSRRGIIDGHFGLFRSTYVPGFSDWTIYGRASTAKNGRTDVLVCTEHFVTLGHNDSEGVPIRPTVEHTRYGAPLYGLDPQAIVLPIYLRTRMSPPTSAHQRLDLRGRYGSEIRLIANLLGFDCQRNPELTWIPLLQYT